MKEYKKLEDIFENVHFPITLTGTIIIYVQIYQVIIMEEKIYMELSCKRQHTTIVKIWNQHFIFKLIDVKYCKTITIIRPLYVWAIIQYSKTIEELKKRGLINNLNNELNKKITQII